MNRSVKSEFNSGDLSYLDAILELTKQGMLPKSAEALVVSWQAERGYGSSALSNACDQDEGA